MIPNGGGAGFDWAVGVWVRSTQGVYSVSSMLSAPRESERAARQGYAERSQIMELRYGGRFSVEHGVDILASRKSTNG